jgi:coenzyme F420 hydrogenase subunit beta
LERKIIDGALVLGTFANNGGWRQESFIARSAEELKAAIKSKYLAVPFLRPLKEMEEIEGNYAVVALPCYIHALRKYQKISKKLRERIKLVVGLYCNVVFEPHLFDDACEFNNIAKENVVNFHFRYGDWPGGVVAELRDGSRKQMLKQEEMKDQFNLLKMFYTAPRCNTCVDFSAEYADIAVGDPWLRGPDGKYLFEDGRTTVLVRTKSGEEIVDMASRDGYVNVKEIGLKTYMVNFEKSGRYKRDFVPKNIMLRRLLRLSFPMYNRAIGVGKLSGFVPMLLRTCILSISRYKWFRRISLRVCQTRPVIAYFAWNRGRKERKFASSYIGMEKFVETLHTIKPSAGDYVHSRMIEDDENH